jgi:hypothetical protein
VDELARITQEFLRGQELMVQGNALMLRAFNALLAYQAPRATRLNATFGAVVAKPPGA